MLAVPLKYLVFNMRNSVYGVVLRSMHSMFIELCECLL